MPGTATATIDSGTVLFNCCTNEVAPDWSQFKSLEIGGCITETSGDDSWTSPEPDATAQFWTVYARHHSGEAEAITDCRTRAAADEAGKALSDLSGLPLIESANYDGLGARAACRMDGLAD